jgi:hypothetical protein
MKWMLAGDWPVQGGARLIPAGTIISDDGDPSAIPLGEVPRPLPINSISLDTAALQMMRQWYGPALWHHLLVGPDVGKAPPQTTSETSPSPAPKKSAKR